MGVIGLICFVAMLATGIRGRVWLLVLIAFAVDAATSFLVLLPKGHELPRLLAAIPLFYSGALGEALRRGGSKIRGGEPVTAEHKKTPPRGGVSWLTCR